MNKRILFFVSAVVLVVTLFLLPTEETNEVSRKAYLQELKKKKKKKSKAERTVFATDRVLDEIDRLKDPVTGIIPESDVQSELEISLLEKQKSINNRNQIATYTSRGPTNLGGRTRAFAIDISDNTGNTMLAGGVSSGLFRSTNGGASWTKVSPNDAIHSVTSVVQDPRPGFQHIWYYGTGEWFLGNSASASGASFRGDGVYASVDGGVTWAQLIDGQNHEDWDSAYDYVQDLAVNPINGDLLIATTIGVARLTGTQLTGLVTIPQNHLGHGWTDVEVASNGRAYISIGSSSNSDAANNGVWTSANGRDNWTKIASNGSPSGWSQGTTTIPVIGTLRNRPVLAVAPSNPDVMYAMYDNGGNQAVKAADIWKYNAGTGTWTDYSSKMPDEPGGNSPGNDPITLNEGYDAEINVKPDDENFVVIGGSNAYKIEDITTDATFTRIGGYLNQFGYAQYNVGGVDHHADIHAIEFNPFNPNVMFTGTDGGVHKTTDIGASSVVWVNLNNNYQTYQYYHVGIDPKAGSNIVIGGAQDNGTSLGGTDAGYPNNTSMERYFSGDGIAVAIARINDGANPQYFYTTQSGGLYTDGPVTSFRSISPTGASSEFRTYFYLDPSNNDHMYFAGNNVLYRTSNAKNVLSSTWGRAGNSATLLSGESIRAIAASWGTYNASSSFILIGGANGGLYRYDDPMNAGSLAILGVNVKPPGASTGASVSSISIHPNNNDIALVTYSNYGVNSIFLTTNATAFTPTWTLIERNLNLHSIRSSAITEVNGKTIYFVGTARGLYSSDDPTSEDWQLQSPNQVGLAVVSDLSYRPADNKLLIGTHGNGMYEVTVEPTLSTKPVTDNPLEATLYPNPTANVLKLSSAKIDAASTVRYVISDLNGRQVKNGTLQNNSVDVRSLNAGVYLINIDADGIKQAMKFVKN